MNRIDSLEVMIGARVMVSADVLDKYNQPGPRYTSYPTAQVSRPTRPAQLAPLNSPNSIDIDTLVE